MYGKASFLAARPSWRTLQALAFTSTALCFLIAYRYLDATGSKYLNNVIPGTSWGTFHGSAPAADADWAGKHPIDRLISDANESFQRALGTEAASLEDVAAKYRTRRKRHPPPGFDAWYHFAEGNGAVLVEELWDHIYHDLGPFWGADPRIARAQAHDMSPKISIRNGSVMAQTNNANVRITQWTDMITTLSRQAHVELPDVDIPLNVNDEPALIVPWETIDTAMSMARPIMPSPAEVLTEFSGLDYIENSNHTFDPEWLGPRLRHPASALGPRPYWSLVRPACAPHSPARGSPILSDIWHPEGHTSDEHSAVNLYPISFPNGTLHGFVANWTVATDACRYPYLQGLHGTFVAPESMSASTTLFPLFGAGKYSMNNDILIPSASDWTSSEIGSTKEISKNVPWNRKQSKLVWRGPATGGKNTEKNWRRFQRHRFVSIMNATNIEGARQSLQSENASIPGVDPTATFRFSQGNPYKLDNQSAEWVDSCANVVFTDLHCDSLEESGEACPYTSPFFSVAQPAQPEDYERFKFTATVDGNGADDGGEFLTRLKQGSVSLKASVYRNWYDSRLWPWVHFVPMDNTFIDVYGVMQYFPGSDRNAEKTDGATDEKRSAKGEKEENFCHDAEAQRIASAAQEWAYKVLRREDMLVYVYRLILEYARVVDDRRERLGWVADLGSNDSEAGRGRRYPVL